ncbi:MAG TPA: universal stress protein [Anaerolineae bacterium]|nr:universal stress protein [Anaerolineae bacterium]
MLDHLLLPLDGSQLAECVLPHAYALAQAFGAHLTIIRVLGKSTVQDRTHMIDPVDWHINKAEAQAYLETIVKRFNALGLSAESGLVEGSAAERIIEYAHDHDIDLVLLSSHGHSGLSGWNISSIVQKIVLRIQRPVMVVRAYQPASSDIEKFRYRRLLVPLDGTQRAECVLPWASQLAAKHEAQLLLIHVVRLPDMPRHVPLTAEEQDLLDQIVERNRVEGIKYLEQVKAHLPAQTETRLLISPRIASALHEVTEQEPIDLILMSAHCYSADTHWPYGSEIVSFLAYGNSPLLIMPDVPSEMLEQSKAQAAAQVYGVR